MLQDIAPREFHNAFALAEPAAADALVYCFRGRSLLIGDDGARLTLPRRNAIGAPPLVYLFRVDRVPFYLALSDVEPPPGFAYEDLRRIRQRGLGPRDRAFAAFTARHLAGWYQSNRFCGACGQLMKPAPKERSLVCAACGHVVYPRLNPAIIAAVTNGDQLLLTRYADGRGTASYALIAGFAEIGETLEETVCREVMEETGLRVKNLRYYKSQPWGITGDILAGFFCEVDGSPAVTMDASELKEAVWTDRSAVTLQPDDFSLTNEMMKRFKDGRA